MWIKKYSGIFVALGLVLAACQGASPSPSGSGAEPSVSEAPAAEQVLRLNMSQEPGYMDPTLASTSIEIQVIRSLTHPLAYFNDSLEVVPGLADSWDISPDGTEITFHLGDHKYSNGDDIIAEDFVYSWRKLSDPRVAADYSYVLEPIVGWGDAQAADPEDDAAVDAALEALGVAAPDPKTFVVTLSAPASYFVFIAALWNTTPQKPDFVWTEADGYVSSGPMILSEWNHQSDMTLEPNPEWTGDPVTIARIELAMINDPTAELAAYDANELDVATVPRGDVARIQDDPVQSGEIVSGDTLSLSYYGFDMADQTRPFAQSQLLRKAFTEALDKEVLLNTVFSGIGTVATSIVPPGMPGYQDTDFVPYDVDQAKIDFDQALGDLGMTADELDLQLGYNIAGSNADQAAFFQEQWRTVFGIEVELIATEDFAAYLNALTENPPDIFRLGWGADYPHPNNFLKDLFGCGTGNNYPQYCNQDVDDLLAEAATKPTLEEQIPLYNEAQEIIMTDLPLFPQLWGQRFTLVKPWVNGLVITAQDFNAGELFYYKTSISARRPSALRISSRF